MTNDQQPMTKTNNARIPLMRSYILSTYLTLLFITAFLSAQPPYSAWVLNTLGENVSMINLENQSVISNAFGAGLYANQMKVRGERAYIVNSGLNAIQVVDLNTRTTLQTINLGPGTNPWGMDFIDDQTAAVSLLFTNQVVFVDLPTGNTIHTVAVGNAPEDVKFHGGKVYVAISGYNGTGFDPGVVSVIDPVSYTVAHVGVGVNPQGLDADLQGNIVVACSGDYASIEGRIDLIDPAAQTVIHSQSVTFGITTVAVSGGNKAYFSTYSEGVLVYDLDSYSFERDENNPLPGGPAVAFDRDDAAYIGDFARDSVYVYDPSHLRQHAFLVGDGPVSLAIFDPAPSGLADGDDSAPEAFALYQNYPNPFNPATNFGFRISDFGFVNLNIFDTTGRKVTKLLAQEMAPGEYELQWDGRDDTGAPVASGVYFYQLSAGGQSAVRRMVLLR